MNKLTANLFLLLLALGAAGCAIIEAGTSDLNAAMEGRPASVTTYDQDGRPIDLIWGESIHVAREAAFDSKDSEGFSNADSDVLRISIGDNAVRHVGSSMIIVEDGLTLVANAPTRVEVESLESGTPWLNHLYEQAANSWDGKAKTIMIRSQDGKPIAVYAGDSVEVFPTSIPNSTRFQVDGMYLFVYRVDFTVYDTVLLGPPS